MTELGFLALIAFIGKVAIGYLFVVFCIFVLLTLGFTALAFIIAYLTD